MLDSLPAVDGRKIEQEARRRRTEKLSRQAESQRSRAASPARKAAA